MDAAFALLLPLVGGFLFIKECTFVKYVAAREDGHRLYFRVAYYAVYLFLASLAILSALWWLLHGSARFQLVEQFFVNALAPLLKDKSQGTAQLGFLLVCLFSVPLGRWSPLLVNKLMTQSNEQALWDAAAQNELEELLLEALAYSKTISITMTSSKVYVGLVLSTFEPRTERRVIALQPLMSGYRTEQGKVNFTTFYDDQIAAARAAADEGAFRLVLPIDKMMSISFFDVAVYAGFNAVAPVAAAHAGDPPADG